MLGVRGKITAKVLQEYLETMVHAQSFQVSNLRNWSLIQCYAEFQYKLNGGAKCPQCRAHVRHVVPVRAEHEDGTFQDFTCLCTRCFEAERAVSKVVILRLGEATVRHYPRVYGAKTLELTSAKIKADANGTGNGNGHKPSHKDEAAD
ncbi:MAG: hypothetical protein JWO13_577 [Acidobacteriales bacterium]|nr:hypothetical protein [Terriglobales bacterium]